MKFPSNNEMLIQVRIANLDAMVKAEFLWGLAADAKSRGCESEAAMMHESAGSLAIYANKFREIIEEIS